MAKLKPNDLTALKELGDVYYMIGEFKLRCGDLAAARRDLENSQVPTQGPGRPGASQRFASAATWA